MNNKTASYERLIQASLILIFVSTLAVGSFSLVSICWQIMESHAPRPEFISTPLTQDPRPR